MSSICVLTLSLAAPFHPLFAKTLLYLKTQRTQTHKELNYVYTNRHMTLLYYIIAHIVGTQIQGRVESSHVPARGSLISCGGRKSKTHTSRIYLCGIRTYIPTCRPRRNRIRFIARLEQILISSNVRKTNVRTETLFFQRLIP